ncbi:MAG: hydroxymethylbilane synthase [Thermoleophilaceae bacterium]
MVAASLADADPEIVVIRTSGDEGGPPTEDKSRFVKEIEQALLRGEIDLAVHSAKDLPSVLSDGLSIVAVPPRADPRDALVGAAGLEQLPPGARVGTSSLRRRAQLLALRPDLEVLNLRGNVDTRLRTLEHGRFDALVLAQAGLDRLERTGGSPLPSDRFTPAAGQGCLALEARSDDERIRAIAGPLTDRRALLCLTAERAVVARLEATCNTPVAAHAEAEAEGEGELLTLRAFAGRPDGSAWVRDVLSGAAGNPAALGGEIAERLLVAGAAELLAELEPSDTRL